MRVLHLGKYYAPAVGGIETVVRELCKGLSKKGVAVTCVVSSVNQKKSVEIIDGVEVIRLGKTFNSRHPINLSLPSFLKKNIFDIVHLHMPNPSAEIGCLLSKPKKLIVSYHADVLDKPFAGIYRSLQKKVLQRADKIIVSSPQYLESSPVLKQFKSKCVVIPYGIDLKRFVNAKKMNDFPHPVFLFVGRLVGYKGIKYLIKAMLHVPGTLFIVGTGPLSSELQSLVKKLQMQKRIHFFTDVRDEYLPIFFHTADVFVLPSISRAEAFGIVQLEAMACGKPVISTKLNTGVEFINQHMRTGLIVPPFDVNALSDSMALLSRDEDLCQKLGKEAKKRVKQQFTLRSMVEQVLRLYRSS